VTETYKIYDTIDEVPKGEWAKASQEGSRGFMDANFLRAVEKGLGEEAHIFYVLLYQGDGKPAACASLCLYRVDLVLLAGPALRNLVGWGRKVFPNLAKVKILMCGLPVSAGQSHLAFAPDADRARAIAQFDGLTRQLARQHRARLIVFKEFGEEDCEYMDLLRQCGYYRADCPASYVQPRAFRSFSAYCAAMNSRHRWNIKSIQQKFERAGCRAVHLDDPDEILRVYTPEVHRLYEAVVEKAELKLEILPHRFFAELVRQVPGRVALTVVYREGRIVAFGWGLSATPEYHCLFCGIDYSQNAECSLYFNVIYQHLDYAFRSGTKSITLGQTAETFKTMLGFAGKPRYLYVRAKGPILSWLLSKCGDILFPPRPPQPAHDVFKKARPATQEKLTPDCGVHPHRAAFDQTHADGVCN
jgi:predicted N-acyltransferase